MRILWQMDPYSLSGNYLGPYFSAYPASPIRHRTPAGNDSDMITKSTHLFTYQTEPLIALHTISSRPRLHIPAISTSTRTLVNHLAPAPAHRDTPLPPTRRSAHTTYDDPIHTPLVPPQSHKLRGRCGGPGRRVSGGAVCAGQSERGADAYE